MSALLAQIIATFLYVWRLLIIARIIFSFFRPAYGSPLARLAYVIEAVTEPVLAPIRRLLPPMVGLDFSPLLSLLLMELIGSLLFRLVWMLPF